MKRKAQEEIYEETKNLTREEELEYFHKAGERFKLEMETLHEKKNKAQQQDKTSKAKTGKGKSTESSLKSKS